MKLAIGPSVVVFLLAFPIGWIVIYYRIRETIRLEDALNGRHFACRSIITLLEKKQQMSEMAEKFTQFLELLKNWGGREVIEMALTGRHSLGLWRGPAQLNDCLETFGL
jgi:hypothetical protein